MLRALSEDQRKALFDLLSLLITIYCAAILGDYVSEALVIKHLTVDVLPNLFQLNAVVLFVVSFILFGFIDKLHRWQLVKILSLLYPVLVIISGILVRKYTWSCIILYSCAYISKLSFFAVFWIIANDICDTRKSKAIFHMLAGGGLLGGLISTIISGKIVHLVYVENLIWLWAFLLIVPFFIINKITREYSFKLNAPNPESNKSFKEEFSEIFSERAVVIMAAVYFLIFLLIFNLVTFRIFIKSSGLSAEWTNSLDMIALFS